MSNRKDSNFASIRPAVSVVIPTYNGLNLLKKNLPFVLSELQPLDELIIIDDAGTDDTKQWVETLISTNRKISISYLRNTQNQRFAATCNRAVSAAKNHYIWLLNNDVSPLPGCLEQLLKSMLATSNVFGVGCYEIETAIGAIGGKNKLWFERGLFVHSRHHNFKSGETAWVSGGSGLFDAKLWKKLGGFDTAFYPAYWEDIDLSYRAQKNGWKILFNESAKVNHNHESTNNSVLGARQIEILSVKNSLVFLWKHATASQKMIHLFWLPYHLLITNTRTKGCFAAGWIEWLLGTMRR